MKQMEHTEPMQTDANASGRKVCFIMPNMAGGGAERVVSVLAGQFADM